MPPSAKLKYDQKYLKKGSKVMGPALMRLKNKNCCMMFILAVNQSCGFPEPLKIFKKSRVLKNGLIFEKGLF